MSMFVFPLVTYALTGSAMLAAASEALHLLGLDHEKLTFRHAGRDFRLTDTKGDVVKGILA